jgi:hypothetical protein
LAAPCSERIAFSEITLDSPLACALLWIQIQVSKLHTWLVYFFVAAAACHASGPIASPSREHDAGDVLIKHDGDVIGQQTADARDAGGPTCKADERPSRTPGPALTDIMAKGSSTCGSTSLADAIEAARKLHPDLADIQELYAPSPNRGGDRSYVYAFATQEGGFALVFRRGGGDCLSGCTENEYWYFRTDLHCELREVGHYLPKFAPTGCLAVEGFPLWDHPAPPNPTSQCGNVVVSGLSPLGSYTKHACGQLLACATKGTPPLAQDLDLKFTIDADRMDPHPIRLTLHNTGVPELDGRPLAATASGMEVHVVEHDDNLPATCPKQHDLEVLIDFGGYQRSFVHYDELNTPDCTGASDVYCKGSLQLDLGYLASNSCTAAMDVRTCTPLSPPFTHDPSRANKTATALCSGWAGSALASAPYRCRPIRLTSSAGCSNRQPRHTVWTPVALTHRIRARHST